MSLPGSSRGESGSDEASFLAFASNSLGGALKKQFREAHKKQPECDSHTLGALVRRTNSQSPEPEQSTSAPSSARAGSKGKKRKRKRDLDAELQAAESSMEEPRGLSQGPRKQPSSTSNTEEVDLTLTADSFQEDFYTDEEAEAAEREAARAAQKVGHLPVQESVEEAWSRLKPIDSHARFVRDVLDDLFGRRALQTQVLPVAAPSLHTHCKCSAADPGCGSSSESDEKDSDSDTDVAEKNRRRRVKEKRKFRRKRNAKDEDHHKAVLAEIQWRRNHPEALNPDIIFNVPERLNDGPACRCAPNHREGGVRHNFYPGEEAVPSTPESCDLASLHHYVLSIDPRPAKGPRPSTVQAWDPTVGKFETYVFSGLSLFFHRALPSVFPAQPQTRFHEGFAFRLLQDKVPVEAIGSALLLDAFHSFLFEGVLELVDVKRWPEEVEKAAKTTSEASTSSTPSHTSTCPVYHVMPRFTRQCKDGVTRLAPMTAVLESLRWAYTKKAYEGAALDKLSYNPAEWEDFRAAQRGRIVINPAKRPCSLRVDDIDAAWVSNKAGIRFPVFKHRTYRLTNLMLMARPEYPLIIHDISSLKMKYAENPDPETKVALKKRESDLQKLRAECMNSRDYCASFSLEGFRPTGLCSDVVQHALIMNVAVEHARFHWALETLEARVGYTFKDRTLLELSLSNPSYVTNCGTNADHARAALANCGLRDYVALGKKVPVQSTKGLLHQEVPVDPLLRGTLQRHSIKQLVQIMKSGYSCKKFALAPGVLNERLEFLGDVVVELIVTIHLFFLLPDHNEGALATFRSAIVQNKNLASLAKKIGLDTLMLFGHGIDFCHEAEYRHALANSFEALMAAIYLDSGTVDDCRRILADALYGDDPEGHHAWTHLRDHMLKAEHPDGDRHLISRSPELQKLTEFEESIGLQFMHIRVLARAFTRRSSPTNTLTHGDNQSLELLGDTLLQFLASDFLYKRYPIFHEGHLSVLRTCLVSNKTQSYVADDICIGKYIVDTRTKKRPGPPPQPILRVKDKADLVESLLGAIYVDRGWGYCKAFARVCFFPRLQIFIEKQSWHDPKSALQQACLALPGARDGERTMPLYRQVSKHGTSNNSHFAVAVSFRGQRIGMGEATNIHDAMMNAAVKGLAALPTLFPKECEAAEDKKMKKAGIPKADKASSSRRADKVPQPQPVAAAFNPAVPPPLPPPMLPSLLSFHSIPSSFLPPPPSLVVDIPAINAPPPHLPLPIPTFPPPPSPSWLNPQNPQFPRGRAPLLPLPKGGSSPALPPPKAKPQSLMDLVFDHPPGHM